MARGVAEPGVNYAPQWRLLPGDAVVVVMFRCLIIITPRRLLCSDDSKKEKRYGSNKGSATGPSQDCMCMYVYLSLSVCV